MMGKRKYDIEKLDKKIKKLRKQVERYRPGSDNENGKEQHNPHSNSGRSGRESPESLHSYSSDSDVLSIHSCHSLLELKRENIDTVIETVVKDKIKINQTKQDILTKKINKMHQKWNAILQNGMSAEVRDFLMEKYEVPTSCQLLTPPKLNEEVAAIIKANSLKRDEKIRERQAIITAAISAIGDAIDNMPIQDNSMYAIEILHDASQLLCDAFHTDSTMRRTLTISCLNKDFKDMIEKTVISKYLFGENLQDKMNACDTLRNKSAEELRFKPPQLWGPTSNDSNKDCQQLPMCPPSGQKHNTTLSKKSPAKQSDKKIRYRGHQQSPIHQKGPKHTSKPKPKPAKQSDNNFNFQGSLQPPIIRPSRPKYTPNHRSPERQCSSVVNNNFKFRSPLQPPIIRQSAPIGRFKTYTLTSSPHSFKHPPQRHFQKHHQRD